MVTSPAHAAGEAVIEYCRHMGPTSAMSPVEYSVLVGKLKLRPAWSHTKSIVRVNGSYFTTAPFMSLTLRVIGRLSVVFSKSVRKVTARLARLESVRSVAMVAEKSEMPVRSTSYS